MFPTPIVDKVGIFFRAAFFSFIDKEEVYSEVAANQQRDRNKDRSMDIKRKEEIEIDR